MPRSSRTLFLVDGTAQLYRAYFALPGLTNDEGLPTNAVYGFTNMLRKLIKDERPAFLAVAFDREGPVFRHEAYADYKANRPPTPEDLSVQAPYARQACEALGVPVLELPGYEADDLIATFTRRALEDGYEIVVVAADKDLMQLVGGTVTLLNPSKEVELDSDGVRESFGVEPGLVGDVLGLMGDAVDNVPGVPGVGQKTALAAVATYGNVEAIIARAQRFAETWESRDQLVDAITAMSKSAVAEASMITEIVAATTRTEKALAALLELERDDAFAERLREAHAVTAQIDATALEAGAPGRKVARGLADLKRVLRGLDRGSGKRAWLSIAQHVDEARLSRELVKLHDDVPFDYDVDRIRLAEPDRTRAAALFGELGFRRLAEEFGADTEAGADGAPAETAAPSKVRVERPSDLAALERVVESCRNAGSFGIELLRGEGGAMQASLVGVAVSWAPGEAAFVAWGGTELEPGGIVATLGPLFADPAIGKRVHDLKTAAHLLRRHELPVNGWELDTRVAAFLLQPGRTAYELDDVAREHLGRQDEDSVLEAPDPEAGEGAGRHAETVYSLAPVLRSRLEEARLAAVYDTIDGPLLPVLERMEARGVRVDAGLLERMSAEMGNTIDAVRVEIHRLAGAEFNVDSPKQMREVLFERLGLEPRKKTAKSRQASTDAQTLDELADEHPIAGKILEYRELAKLKGTYVDALPRLIDPATGRIHTRYDPAGAATGRLSSSDPNLQNIPVRSEAGRKIRAAFVPEDGCVFLASDYSQIELRVLAQLTGDPGLTEAFRSGQDIHRHTAAKIFDVNPDLVSDPMRRRAKAINFGLLYGMSQTRLAREQGISRADAKRFIEAYFSRFAKVRDYIEQVREQARRDAAVRTMFGRVRYFPQLHRRTTRPLLEQALRAAVNTTVQGTAADLMKLAMLAVERTLEEQGLRARPLLQVHDELLLEVPTDELDRCAEAVRSAMEQVHPLEVPLVVDQKSGNSWLEAT